MSMSSVPGSRSADSAIGVSPNYVRDAAPVLLSCQGECRIPSMPDVIDPQLSAYLDGLVPERHPELRAMEQYAAEHDFPIVGPACAHVCYQVARMIGARRVFELGSGYGYSTAFFARAVKENGGGDVHHVVWDEALPARAPAH